MSLFQRLADCLRPSTEGVPDSAVLSDSVAKKLIVGLGNPGKKYSKTRHNIGFEVCQLLASRSQAVFKPVFKWKAEIAATSLGVLVKPLTFMNESGRTVRALADYYEVPPEDCLIVFDDVSLPFGSLRIRRSGSAGGHNGVKSIISCLGSKDFPRLKIGIGSADGKPMTSHVLGTFDKGEREQLPVFLESAADAVEAISADGLDQAMARWNVKPA
jgi:PTH1 family peptidyl-tRNA hydrolase